VNPSDSPKPGMTRGAFAGSVFENLVEYAAIGEMIVLRFIPSTEERIVYFYEPRVQIEYIPEFVQNIGVRGPVKILGGYFLPYAGIQVFEISGGDLARSVFLRVDANNRRWPTGRPIGSL
jgi:hypothetical protein